MYIFIYVEIIHFIYQTSYFFFRRHFYYCSSVCIACLLAECGIVMVNWTECRDCRQKISVLTQSVHSELQPFL